VFCLFGVAVFANSNQNMWVPYNTQSVNGATGLIMTPNANVGWGDPKNIIGIDGGYHLVADFNGYGHVAKATVSLFGRAEIGGMWDNQKRDEPNDTGYQKKQQDVLFHGKFKIFNNPALGRFFAIGGNFQWINRNNSTNDMEGKVVQLYLAYTFASNIFNMLPVDTTFVFGKTMTVDKIKIGYRKKGDEKQLYFKFDDKGDRYSRIGDFDFSVGFDVDLFPQYLKHYVRWVTDFANYSYSVDAMGTFPGYRACANTGLRLVPMNFRYLKWNIDMLLIDFLDHNREWAVGTSIGFGI